MTNAEYIKRAADQVLGEEAQGVAAPAVTPEAPASFSPESSSYALLYKTPSGMRLPYDKPDDIAKLTADDIKKAGDFPGHGANFAWDRVYWLFTLPAGSGDKVLCCYSGTMNVDGSIEMESLTTASPVKSPDGKELDVDYLSKNFQGQYPFKEARLNLDQFSDADTVVVVEEHNSPMQVPAEAEQLKGLLAFFHLHGKPYSSFRSNTGSFRMWDVKKNQIATVDGAPDKLVQDAITKAMANTAAPEQAAPAGADVKDVFTPLGEGSKPDSTQGADSKPEGGEKDLRFASGTEDADEKNASDFGKKSDQYKTVGEGLRKINPTESAKNLEIAKVYDKADKIISASEISLVFLRFKER